MERLLELLEEVENSAITPREYLDESHHSAIPLIKSLLNDLLITKDGSVDWTAKDELCEEGYPCFAVEQDRFGWVIGGVETEKGVITFG